MENVLEANVKLVNNGLKFECTADNQPPIYTDHPIPPAVAEGYSPIQLVLIGLATCSGGTAVALLRKFRKDVSGFSVEAHGTLREQHPLSFSRIDLAFTVVSADATEDDVKLAVTKAEEKYCPVWAMIKGNVEVAFTVEVKRP
jgi:putative redox protein